MATDRPVTSERSRPAAELVSGQGAVSNGAERPTFQEEVFRFLHGDFLRYHSMYGFRPVDRLRVPEAGIRRLYAYRSSFISFLVEEHGCVVGIVVPVRVFVDPVAVDGK